ncbi:deoxycytidylate deaminase [Methylobacterium currus]|uniref:Deoxycytidylate deaminase n=1 Tax=Methylobacterium currus TaxID=2051553 RepID=A0A2R4WGH7_9HYPH|nr:deaminase [Methylobacterium currus]AWB20644.1 deoxycytidylate deaminase [Methylobacterium currus]
MTYSQKWDLRFLEMADMVAGWSKDPSSKVGAVLVRPDRTLASVGFNGFPRGLNDAAELYADRDYKIATVRHAEENAIGFAKDQSLEGHTLYVSGLPPCCSCASEIIQSGIARVVARHNMVPVRWVRNMSWAIDNMLAKGIVVDTYDGHTGTWHEITRPADLWLEAVEGSDPAAQACACAA